MSRVFHNPPGWPVAPKGWVPAPTWRPDPTWPAPQAGWVFWTDTALWPDGPPLLARNHW